MGKMGEQIQERRRAEASAKLKVRGYGATLPRADALATAVHESAHAVFFEAFGVTVNCATCLYTSVDDTPCLGRVTSNADSVAIPGIMHVLNTLAGDIAEHRLLSREKYHFDRGFISNTDASHLLSFFDGMQIPDGNRVDACRRFATLCSQMVDYAWKWIEAVAIEMYAQGTLRGDKVREILRDADFYSPNNLLTAFRRTVLEYAAQQIEEETAVTVSFEAEKNEAQMREWEWQQGQTETLQATEGMA
jgi:hypothetical protein